MQHKSYLYFIVSVVLMIATDPLSAQMSNCNTEVQRLKVLPETGHYLTTVELLSDANGSLIVFCRIYPSYYGYKNKAFVFLKQQDKWSETEKVCEGNAEGVISAGQFKLITFGNLTHTQEPLKVFDFKNDLQISSQPRLVLDLSNGRKFKNEYGRELVSVAAGDRPDSFLVLGKYYASNLNLLTFLGRLISAGHAGIVELPFAVQITDDKIVGFYNLQTKFKDNDDVRKIAGVIEHQKVHVTWVKGKHIGGAARKVMYAQFNMDTHNWSDVSELFRGPVFNNKVSDYYGSPSLILSSNGVVHCAWANANIWKETGIPRDDSGVLYRSRNECGWSEPYKITDSAASQCKLSIGKDQSVHVFWVDYDKRVYHSYKDTKGWCEVKLIHEDPNMNWHLPFDAKVDWKGNFHLVYIRTFPPDRTTLKYPFIPPDELVYVKVSKEGL